jgi:hypothetical protein
MVMRPSLVSRKIVFCGSLACWAKAGAMKTGTRPASMNAPAASKRFMGGSLPFG